MNPLLISGVVVAVAGPFLVTTVGLSDACSSEVTSKVVEYVPAVVGLVMAFFGHKKGVGAIKKLRAQVNNLGAIPHA